MKGIEDLNPSQQDKCSLIKTLLPSWPGARIGIICKTEGSICQEGEVILYKTFEEIASENIMIQRLTGEELGRMQVLPKAYIDDVTEYLSQHNLQL